MKVAFLGNVNNHPFIVAKHFRDKNVEVIFFLDTAPENTLSRPESTGLVNYPYPDWIREVPVFRKSAAMHFPKVFAPSVIREINGCDAVITNDYGHRILPLLRKDMISVCMFTGGDLEIMGDYDNVMRMKLSNPKLRILPSFLKKIYARLSVNQLRKAISQASLIGYFPEGLNDIGDRILKEIFGTRKYNRYNHWCVMLDGLQYTEPPKNKKIRVFNVARFMWKKPFPAGRAVTEDKGNDIMIRALGAFLKDHPGTLDIHFVEKGLHVEESKQLIDECGFAGDVTWHSEMPVNALFKEIEKADIIFDQLGPHLFGAGIFGMAIGRPLIANARLEILSQVASGDEIPVCHAINEDGVYQWLKRLVFDDQFRVETGKKSSDFAFMHMDIKQESGYYYSFIKEELGKRSST